MFKLKGFCRVVVTDSRTGEIKREIEKENVITDEALRSLASDWILAAFFDQRRISISTQVSEPNSAASTVSNIIATGYIPNGVNSPRWFNENPFFGQIQNRIDQVGVSRVFNTIALTALGSANTQSNLSATAAAYLKLDVPCTQGEFDILDIFYRIQFLPLPESSGLLPDIVRGLARCSFGFSRISSDGFTHGSLWSWIGNPSGKGYARLFGVDRVLSDNGFAGPTVAFFSGNGGLGFLGSTPSGGWSTGSLVSSHFKWRMSLSQDLEGGKTGSLVNTFLQGSSHIGTGILSEFDDASVESDRCLVYSINKYFKNQTSPIQNTFSHSSSGTRPFFESLALASGNGKVLAGNGQNWTEKYPQMFRILITQSGAVGVSQYRLATRSIIGFRHNTWIDQTITLPYLNERSPAYGQGSFTPGYAASSVPYTQHGWQQWVTDYLPFDKTRFVTYDLTGITLLDVIDGDHWDWDKDTVPPLPVTDLRQCAVDIVNQKIYAACRNTGLWEIDVTANTVTKRLELPCYGVDVGVNGRAWAIASNGLYSSLDWATPVPFVFSDLTADWSRCFYLKCDPEHPSHRIGIIAATPAGGSNRRVVWKSEVSSTAIAGFSSNNISVLPPVPSCFDCSDVGGFWATGNAGNFFALQYGNGSATNSSAGGGTADFVITHPVYGAINARAIRFLRSRLIGRTNLISSDLTVEPNAFVDRGTSPHCVLPESLLLFNRNIRPLFTGNASWQEYGWNGSQWVLGESGSKATHATDDALIQGLTIRFENGANAPHFTATDYYTFGVCWGLLKDNATRMTYESGFYTKPVVFDSPVSATVPASAPYEITLPAANIPSFLRIETDSPSLIQLAIAGTPVTRVYIGGSIPPAPNEIRVNASGNGVVEFNPSDAGKTVTGVYTYLTN